MKKPFFPGSNANKLLCAVLATLLPILIWASPPPAIAACHAGGLQLATETQLHIDENISPLAIAAATGNVAFLRQWLRPMMATTAEHDDLLLLAFTSGNLETILFVLDAANNSPNNNSMLPNPLCLTIENGSHDIFAALLVDHRYLEIADAKGNRPAHAAVLFRDNDALRMLINAGIDLESLDAQGRTPLRLAVETDFISGARLLLRAGASREGMPDLPAAIGTAAMQELFSGSLNPTLPPLQNSWVFSGLPTREKVIALTFDDGPSRNTGALLAILAEKSVPATFFVLGQRARSYPGLIQAMKVGGHDLGNHGWSHADADMLDGTAIEQEIRKCADALARSGVDLLPFFRPPYGRISPEVNAAAAHQGYHIILWNVDSEDWLRQTDQELLESTLAQLKPGAIILFHEKNRTLRILPEFIDRARAMGYRFVLLSDYLP